MSGKDELLEKIALVFHDVFNDSIEVSLNTNASDIDEWDSLTHIRLMITIEAFFSVKFTVSEMSEMQNVSDLILILEEKLNVRP